MRERYLRVPENLISELRLLLRSIAILSRGYLPPQLFSPTDIVRISQAALAMIKNKHPDYVLAIPQASSYYDIKPDTPINVYTRFCLNTAKSKFSLVSPVAD